MAASRKAAPVAAPETSPTAADRAAEEARQASVAAAVAAAHRDELPRLGDHPDGAVTVRPVRGHVLADVPRSGARMAAAQAAEWQRLGLVAIVADDAEPEPEGEP